MNLIQYFRRIWRYDPEPVQVCNWICMNDNEPKEGQKVITWHQLDRIDILTFRDNAFYFPITCPVDRDGNPLGWTSSYPKHVIKFWMPIPTSPHTIL